jgi:hypothetical protein
MLANSHPNNPFAKLHGLRDSHAAVLPNLRLRVLPGANVIGQARAYGALPMGIEPRAVLHPGRKLPWLWMPLDGFKMQTEGDMVCYSNYLPSTRTQASRRVVTVEASRRGVIVELEFNFNKVIEF